MSVTTTITEAPKVNFEVASPVESTLSLEEEQLLEEPAKVELKKSSTRTGCCGKPYYDATLNYRLDVTKGGDEIIWGGTYGQMRRKYEKAPVRIFDERDHIEDFKLDVQGFELIKHKTEKLTLIDDVVPVRGSPYDEECEEIMKKA